MIVWYRCFIREDFAHARRPASITTLSPLPFPGGRPPLGPPGFAGLRCGPLLDWPGVSRRASGNFSEHLSLPGRPSSPTVQVREARMATTLAKWLRSDKVSALRLRDVCRVSP